MTGSRSATQGEHVAVWRGYDPVQAELIEDVLAAEGLSPRLIGTRNAPLIGVGQHILGLRVEVPADERIGS